MNFLETIDPSIWATLIIGMITVLLAVYINYKSQEKIKEREIEEAHRKKKIEMYYEFFDFISKMFTEKNPNIPSKKMSEVEMAKFIIKFKKNILLWGSPKVIKAQSNFEKISSSVSLNEEKNTKTLLFSVDELYRSMREDIGLSNKGLKKGDLLRLSLKDPDEL